MEIKVLGSGCAKCNQLEQVARAAVDKLGIEADVKHVTDIGEIVRSGVMMTPALMVDGEVKIAGRVPKVDEVVALLRKS